MGKREILTEKFVSQFNDDNIIRGSRDGTEIEKGVVLTEAYLEKYQKQLELVMELFTAYPDL